MKNVVKILLLLISVHFGYGQTRYEFLVHAGKYHSVILKRGQEERKKDVIVELDSDMLKIVNYRGAYPNVYPYSVTLTKKIGATTFNSAIGVYVIIYSDEIFVTYQKINKEVCVYYTDKNINVNEIRKFVNKIKYKIVS